MSWLSHVDNQQVDRITKPLKQSVSQLQDITGTQIYFDEKFRSRYLHR